jgi:carbonic anhydrase
MPASERLLNQNRLWADETTARDPEFFQRLVAQQSPEFLWIGCSDSRVPAEITVNAKPGEIFVHRNIANQIIATDFNSLSVVQYAVEVLKVRHIIVCGHYGCGGIMAALDHARSDLTLLNNWLMHIKDIYRLHEEQFRHLDPPEAQVNRLVEYNIVEQIYRLTHIPIIQKSWKAERRPTLHGWVYGLDDGRIRELIRLGPDYHMEPIYQFADLS